MSTEEVSLKIRAGKPFFFCISVPRIKVQRGEGEEKPFFEVQKKDLSFFLLFGWNGADAAGRERSRIFIEICGRGKEARDAIGSDKENPHKKGTQKERSQIF